MMHSGWKFVPVFQLLEGGQNFLEFIRFFQKQFPYGLFKQKVLNKCSKCANERKGTLVDTVLESNCSVQTELLVSLNQVLYQKLYRTQFPECDAI